VLLIVGGAVLVLRTRHAQPPPVTEASVPSRLAATPPPVPVVAAPGPAAPVTQTHPASAAGGSVGPTHPASSASGPARPSLPASASPGLASHPSGPTHPETAASLPATAGHRAATSAASASHPAAASPAMAAGSHPAVASPTVAAGSHPAAPAPLVAAASHPTVVTHPATASSAGAAHPAVPAPSFDIVRVTPQGEAVIAGRAAPGAEVTVHSGTQTLGETRADASGSWVLLPDKPLAPGGHELTLSARDQPFGPPPPAATAGHDRPWQSDQRQSASSVLIVVPDHRANAAVALGTGPETGTGTALAVLAAPGQTSRLLQGPQEAGAAAVVPPKPGGGKRKLDLSVVDYDDRGAVRFGGHAPAGAPVRVYVDNHLAGDAHSDAAGEWTLTPEAAVPAGKHQLRVDQLAPTGRVVARVELPFQRVVVPAATIGPGRVVVQPGDCLWRIARVEYGQGVRYVVIYRANKDEIRNPNLIYPGQIFAIPPATAAQPTAARPG